jgi:hypothetical protein
MSIEAELLKCPSCKCAVDVHVLGFTSLLGPQAVLCHWCGTAVRTDRMEWWQMALRAKIWFFFASLFYAVLAYFAGGLSTNSALHLLETGQWRKDWGIDEPSFWLGGGAWASLVVFLQFYRITRSLRRRKELEEKPLRCSLLSFQVGGQIKLLILLLLVPAVCWVVGWIGRR